MGAILASALEEEGFTVHFARTGQDALALAREARPDLVTLDLGLPGLTGWDVVAALRADPHTRELPVIAVSAHANELDDSFRSQVTRVIAKPFYLSEVVSAVEEALGLERSE